MLNRGVGGNLTHPPWLTVASQPLLQSTTQDSQDSRSDDKGAEPESLAYGVVGSRPYVFVGLERTSLIGAWDVTDLTRCASNSPRPLYATTCTAFVVRGDCGWGGPAGATRGRWGPRWAATLDGEPTHLHRRLVGVPPSPCLRMGGRSDRKRGQKGM